nr:MAG TPA: hypothetical protein [Caudoviricetes sp.]
MRSTDKSITFVLFNKINIEYENKKISTHRNRVRYD